MPMTLNELADLTKSYADARGELTAAITELNDELEAVRRRRLTKIRRLVAESAQRHNELANGLETSRDLFTEQRTVMFHGIKIGFRKGTGRIEWEDDAGVIRLIRRHFPDQADLLIHTEERPNKKAIRELSGPDLRRIGCTVTETGDEAFIKPADSEVDKIVNALLREATEDVASAAA